MPERLKLAMDLNVLNHLGLNLYSNVPAVLSELIANAWDADASRVDVSRYCQMLWMGVSASVLITPPS